MSEGKHLLITIAGALGVLLVGGAVLVWPVHREKRRVQRKITALERKIDDLSFHTARVERLADQLEETRRLVDEEMKLIPTSPDIAALMRKLSMPVDDRTVIDQTFTAGAASDAVAGAPYPEQAMPLTVDMEARFDSVFALIRGAERLDRLVRVATIRLAVERPDADRNDATSRRRSPTGRAPRSEDGEPILTASVGLEVIFRPSLREGE
jgi:Tfp pilus assembly protein PilO